MPHEPTRVPAPCDFSGLGVLLLALSGSVPIAGAVLQCIVDYKLESNGFVYDQARLERMRASVIVRDEERPSLERCFFAPSEGRVTCDRYAVDHVSNEDAGGKKFYHFAGKFDVQVFPNYRFVENNGRGGIAFGRCKAKDE